MEYMTQEEYDILAMGLWHLKLDDVNRAGNDYRRHLLAGACLREAAGPGGDPIALSDFCRSWERVLTLPKIGPFNLIKSIPQRALEGLFNTLGGRMTRSLSLGKLYSLSTRAGPIQALSTRISPAAFFDITQSINWGIKLIGAMGPLLRRGRMNLTTLTALSNPLVPEGDRGSVGAIIDRASSPEDLLAAIAGSREAYMNVWAEALIMANRMADIQIETTPRWGGRRGR